MSEARVRRLERIIEISRSLNSTLRLQLLLERIIDAARELTDTEASSIMLLDRKTGRLHFEAATGRRSQEIRSVVVPMEDSLAGWVVKHSKPLVINDVRDDSRFYGQVDEEVGFDTRSLIATPLKVKGRTIGVLEVVNKRSRDLFSEEDLETLVILADQAAVAIENAVLFQQSDLVAEMVHEMRTPLTSMTGYAVMIQRTDVSEEQRKDFARTIQREAGRLNRLTDDFLELARLESGRAFLKRELTSLEPVVAHAVNLLLPKAQEKRIALSSEPLDDLPAVSVDKQRLGQALVNLVGNAVKYCGEGDRVTVSAQVTEDKVVICVADTGPGIPQEAQEHLFQKFYRIPQTREQAKGTGLGLAITRHIAEAHGGRVWVESEEGDGAAFYLAIPRCEVPPD